MKRFYAFAISLAMLLAIPALVPTTASAAPVSRDQYVKIVIDRGLAQRGVPYSWAGGDINGPTLGTGTGCHDGRVRLLGPDPVRLRRSRGEAAALLG